MANPLSDRGFTDRDYAALVGTLAGEAAVNGNLKDYQAIADVIANRQSSGLYGNKSIAGLTMDAKQFSAWSPQEKSAYQNAMAGFAASLNPQRAASFSPAIQERVELAKQAVNDVFSTGIARGITQGATAYHNPDVTAKLGTDSWHNSLENRYGSLQIGQHSFTGQGFRPDVPFDPVTYNGQLAAPPVAEVDLFNGIGLPTGQVASLGPVPDLTPQSPASAGFSFGGFDLGDVTLSNTGYNDIMGGLSLEGFTPADYGPMPDIMSQFDQGSFPDITAGTAFDPLTGISPVEAAAPNFDDVDLGTYPDISQGIYDNPTEFSVPTTDWGAMPETFGPDISEQAPQGFSAGFDAGPWGQTPDFSAPSLDARNAMDRFEGVMDVRTNPAMDMTNEAIASRVNTELAPQVSAPQLATPSFDMQAAYTGDWADKVSAPTPAATPQQSASGFSAPPMGDWSIPDVSIAAPSLGQSAAVGSLNAPSAPAAPSPNYGGMVDSTFGMGKPQGGFMDAMANPAMAQAAYGKPQQGGFFDGLTSGWSGPGLAVGALGLATAGPLGAIAGYQAGKLGANLFGGGLGGGYQGSGLAGDTFSNDRGFRDIGGWSLGNLDRDVLASLMNGSAYGDWGGWDGSRDTGFGGAPGGLGDGSFSEHAGYNDNSPQGIL